MLQWFWSLFRPAKTLHVDILADGSSHVNVTIGSNIGSDVVTYDDDYASDDDIVGVDVGVDVDDSQHSDEGNQTDS